MSETLPAPLPCLFRAASGLIGHPARCSTAFQVAHSDLHGQNTRGTAAGQCLARLGHCSPSIRMTVIPAQAGIQRGRHALIISTVGSSKWEEPTVTRALTVAARRPQPCLMVFFTREGWKWMRSLTCSTV